MQEPHKEFQSPSGDVHEAMLGRCIGAGLAGNVYELNGKNGTALLINKKRWVVKETFFSQEREEKVAAQHYLVFSKDNITKPRTFFRNHYMVMERVPGIPLSEINKGQFTTSQRLEIANLIIQHVNRFHHCTLSSHTIIHNDLHSGNVLVDIDTRTRKINSISIVDFGRSIEAKDDNPDTLYRDQTIFPFIEARPHTGSENRNHVPFVSPASAGIKSDIYQVAVLLDEFLYSLSSIFSKIGGVDIELLYSDFKYWMKEANYRDRPDSDQVLRFYSTLYRLYKIDEENPKDYHTKIALIAKLVLISNKQWKDKINMEEKSDHIETWENFDFEDENNMHSCRAIVMICKYPTLRGCMENIFSRNAELSEKIVSATSQNEVIGCLAEKFGVDFLFHMHGTIKQRKEISVLAISYLLDKASNRHDVEAIGNQLEALKKENKIDFLCKRQGHYCQFSFHNHKWKNEKVSGTWVNIMKMIEEKRMDFVKPGICGGSPNLR